MDHDALVALVDRAATRDATPEVVERAQEEVSELFLAHEDRVYGLCLRFVGDPERAVSLATMAIRTAHRRLGEWRGEGPFWPWLYGVVRAVCLRHLARKQNLLTADGVLIPGSEAAKALAPMRREDWQELLRQVGTEALSSDEQEAAYLRYVEGLEVTEVTEVLQGQGTGARGLLQRSRHKLGLVLRTPPALQPERLSHHPRFSELAGIDVADTARNHLTQCPMCRVDRQRLRAPMGVRARDLDAVRPALQQARSESGRVLMSSWRTALSGGPARDDASRLSLLPHGTRLGAYQLDGLVGRSGMAVGYRAHRADAGPGEHESYLVEVLATRDANVRSRLQREFRQLRSLRHDYVVEVVDHLQVEGSPALVKHFVDGPTLQELLRHEVLLPLDLIDALAVQILSGMAAAHAEGLVHRDLRTANILLAVGGSQVEARITGLGLARLLSVLEGGAGFGTPPYMAPEQLQDATRSDARSDVFALGTVLYELATGQRCFAAPDHVEAVRRVMELDYVAPEILREELPERMVTAINACLKQDPDARPKSAAALLDLWTRGAGSAKRVGQSLTEGDVAAYRYLRRIRPLPEGLDTEAAGTETEQSAPSELPPASVRPRSGNIAAFVGVLGILMAAASGALWSTLESGPASAELLSWPIARGVPFTVDPDLSPDGRTLVFSDHVDLWVLGLDEAQPMRLTGEFGPAASDPDWSPDGRHVAFSANGGVYSIAVRGREVRYVAVEGYEPTWSPDGDSLAFVSAPTPVEGPTYPRRAGLSVVNIKNGHRRDLVEPTASGPVQPAWAPNGIQIAWATPEGLVVAATEGGAPVPLPGSEGHWHPVWLDDTTLLSLCPAEPGHAICRFQQGPRGWTGSEAWLPLSGADAPRSFDVSAATRRLVLGLARRSHAVLQVAADGSVGRVPRDRHAPSHASPSPEGESLVALDEGKPGRLLLRGAEGGWRTLAEVDDAASPTWRPDGSRITFTGVVAGEEGLFEVSPESGEVERLSPGELAWLAPAFWAPDGERLAWTDRGVGSSPVVIDPTDDWQAQLDEARAEALDGSEAASFSSDGSRLAVRVGPTLWGVVDLAQGGSLSVEFEGAAVVWEGPDRLLVADGPRIRRYDLGAGELSEPLHDLTPWHVGEHPALARDTQGAIWVSAWAEAGGLQRIDVPPARFQRAMRRASLEASAGTGGASESL